MKISLLKVVIFFLLFVSIHSVHSKNRDDFVKGLELKYPVKKIDSLLATAIQSKNFLISYKKSHCSDELAKQFAIAAEYVREMYISWGFQAPSSMQNRFNISILPQGSLSKDVGGHYIHGGLHTKFWWQNSLIEIQILPNPFEENMPLTISSYFETLAHEIFHAFQFGYSTDATSWLEEATADALAREIMYKVDDRERDASYISFPRLGHSEYIHNWHEKGFFDETNKLYKYDSAGFFLYLIHHFRDGPYQKNEIIKKLWELKPSKDKKTLIYFYEIMDGKENFEKVFHDYSVFVLTTIADWHKHILPALQQLDNFRGLITRDNQYIDSFKPDTGSLRPYKYTVSPLSNLFLSFAPLPPIAETLAPFSFAVVKKNESTKTKSFFSKKKGKPTFLEMKNNIYQVEHITDVQDEVIVVITNPTEEESEIEISAVYGAPPFTRKVNTYDDKNNLVYSAEWIKSRGEGDNWQWELDINKNGLPEIEENTGFNLKFEVFVSNKLEGDLILETDKNRALKFTREEEAYGYVYEGSAQVNIQKKQKELQLAFSGTDLKGNKLDPNPRTRPYLNKIFETVYWENYEGGKNEKPIGGIDKTHKIKIGASDADGEKCSLPTVKKVTRE